MAHSRIFALTLALSIAGALSPSLATAAETFDGVCDMSGTVRHEPPLTQVPMPTEIRGSFKGTCSGTLTGGDGSMRTLDAAPAAYKVHDAGGALSCLGGTATGTGS